ncbi:BA75_02939T0 [Komagataella pastoris]|uniref:BA75_02939T0 n=1 Tax=Komagataella pastoris TaxID=4922 RepID=A0A1B2JAC0_PICPA|nr:BA75_02939T0 [Komagataella pastoris]
MSDEESENKNLLDQVSSEKIDQETQPEGVAASEEPEALENEPKEPVSDDDSDSDLSDISDVDEEKVAEGLRYLDEQTAASLSKHKAAQPSSTHKKKEPTRRRAKQQAARETQYEPEVVEDEAARRTRLFEEKLDAAIKRKPNKRKKNDDVDLEQMQDELIQQLKLQMEESAIRDANNIEQGKPAIFKLKLLPKVKDILLRANLADSILDNNLLASVRLWLEPLPDASLPAYQIQKVLFDAIKSLPIKTSHLRESGLGKVMVFYQKSKRVEPNLKRTAEKLISDWTRPIMGASDNYKDMRVRTQQFDPAQFAESLPGRVSARPQEAKTLYEEAAERRKRAAIPQARTAAYTIAPQVNTELLMSSARRTLPSGVGSSLSGEDQYKRLNSRLNTMGTKRKSSAKKGGISIEGRGLPQ